jgi:hypothetical protein
MPPSEVLDRAAAFDAPSDLERQRDHYKSACIQMQHEVCQTLGKALGFPMYKDDQVVFPGADDSTGYFTEPHTAETMALLALDRITANEHREAVLRLALEMIVQQGASCMDRIETCRAFHLTSAGIAENALKKIRRTAEQALREVA